MRAIFVDSGGVYVVRSGDVEKVASNYRRVVVNVSSGEVVVEGTDRKVVTLRVKECKIVFEPTNR